MVPGRQFRYHATVPGVQVDLAVQGVRKQPFFGVVKGYAGLIAGGLNSKNQHADIVQIREIRSSGSSGLKSGFYLGRMHCYNARPFFPRSEETALPQVKVRENEPFEVALRRFKRSCEKAGILSEVRRREFYEKPTQERKRKQAAAVKRHAKKVFRENARRTRLY